MNGASPPKLNRYSTAGNIKNKITYYSYDILGNVDTLVQEYRSGVMKTTNNSLKKTVYDYDLQSGKVDKVTYQHGYPDAFYHIYQYDAENRLTNVQTSADSVNWDNDAYYSYYLHGPLSRTILGDQQVQGINYAYTLQGWMKEVNPPIYSGTGYVLQPDGSSGSEVASNAYNLLLNYYDQDYAAVSPITSADNGVNTTLGTGYRPLYNGNISSIGANIGALGHPLLYNYQYDQLNRLVHMDAWNNTGSTWSSSSILPDFQENVAYDPNGNILQYKRNGNNTFAGSSINMDSLSYAYTYGTNKLDHISDNVASGNYPNDIDNQSLGNYTYDALGELTADAASSITGITWTVYGKINTITKSGSTIAFTYDPAGNRISKTVTASGNTITTWYVRDAQGNVMSIYTAGDPTVNSGDLTQTEVDMYGSSRLGLTKCNIDLQTFVAPTQTSFPLLGWGTGLIFTRGNKLFELTNHLGNVLATVSDKKIGVSLDGSTVDHFNPLVLDANDYYPFGSLEPGRTYAATSAGNYRYGFNGKENDNEVKGLGDQQDYGMRIYDPRVGRFLSVDPLTKAFSMLTPYQFASNSPIANIDLDGKEAANAFFGMKKMIFGITSLKMNNANSMIGNIQEQSYTVDINDPTKNVQQLQKQIATDINSIYGTENGSFSFAKQQKSGEITKGDYIQIDPGLKALDIAVKVADVQTFENKKPGIDVPVEGFSITFRTLEGHVEVGVIIFTAEQFTNPKTGAKSFRFDISSTTQIDHGIASIISSKSRKIQQAVWNQVLTNVASFMGGKVSDASQLISTYKPSDFKIIKNDETSIGIPEDSATPKTEVTNLIIKRKT